MPYKITLETCEKCCQTWDTVLTHTCPFCTFSDVGEDHQPEVPTVPTIEERIAKAKWAMDAYEDEETDVIDLLTDLMHYCHQNGPCFESSARMASIHFNEEVMKENHQPKETWTCCGGVEIDPSDRCPTCGDMY